ncbi:MAG: hypothetical protein HPY54_10665 [Chthonomonadetes bacterium]|nr:hypothetical protein [Chthonomonadetes bacterium]
MNDSHRRHLFALLVQMEDTVSRMTQAGWMGISPSGGGQRLTPLPPSQWKMLQEVLERLVESYHDAMSQLAPQTVQQHDQPEPIEVTYYWLRLLLGSLHDTLLPEMDPDRIVSRYGALSEQEREAINRLRHAVERELQSAQQVVQMRFIPRRGQEYNQR